MIIRIDSCSDWDCALDFYPAKPITVSYRFVKTLEELKELVKGDRVWPALIDNYEKWLKDYEIVADLGYIVFYNGGRIERIVGIHLYYSTWLKRPELRVAEIAKFTSEFFEDDD